MTINDLNILKTFIDAATDMIFFTDPEGVILYVNNAAKRMFGKEDDVHGKNVEDVFPPPLGKQHRKVIKEVFRTGIPFFNELLEIFPEKKVWIDARLVPVESSGKRIGVLGISRDISERKKIELELFSSKKMLSGITKLAPNAIFVTDDQGYTEMWNDAAEKMFGYTQSDVMGKVLYKVVVPQENHELVQAAYDSYQESIAGPSLGKTGEYTATKKNGEKIQIELSLAAFVIDEKKKVIGIVRDISKRKRVESESFNLQTKLLHASKLASIGTMAAGIAHELNNPLTIIKSHLNLIKGMTQNDIENRSAYQEINEGLDRALERIINIVDGLRTYARVDVDSQELGNLHKAINETMSLCQFMLKAENIEIISNLDKEDFFAFTTQSRLQQVVMNIVMNAKDAIKKKNRKGTINIETIVSGNEGVLTISDDGCGIPKDVIAKLFDPFYTTKPTGEGTGLGLSITHAIITAAKGTVNVSSEVGDGTSFVIKLPVSKIEKEGERSFEKNLKDKRELSGSCLVVEDEPLIRRVLLMYLEEIGIRGEAVNDGEMALEKMKTEKYDYVITDMIMPKMPGDVLIEKAAKFPLAKDIIFIVSTGGVISEFADQVQKRLDTYAHGFLKKPFDKNDLYRVISLAKQKKENKPING